MMVDWLLDVEGDLPAGMLFNSELGEMASRDTSVGLGEIKAEAHVRDSLLVLELGYE